VRRNDTLTSTMHLLYIYIQLIFKSTIEFVGPNVDYINSNVDLKMRCIRDV
jgi:hypothetical protein